MTEARPRRSFLRYALITVPVILGLGMVSGWLSNSGYGNPWFDALAKPEIMPPAWLFGVAWTVLYILIGLAIALILAARHVPVKKTAVALFGAQMLLNFSWSAVFFGMHLITPALVIILLMLGLAIGATFLFARIRQVAAWLMMPYLGWLAFAALLNYRILQLNPGA
ncbi:MAG TPA: TspO/MBR family protein [Allosphingosinicella sp.]|nr:TspO/MBR family protein [Allosphingosinicella sp.]